VLSSVLIYFRIIFIKIQKVIIISKKGIKFCIECGNTNVRLFNNRCKKCYIESHPLIKIKSKLSPIKICKECFNYYHKQWTRPKSEVPYDYFYEIIDQMISEIIEFDDDVIIKFEINTPINLIWINKALDLTIESQKFFNEFNETLNYFTSISVKINFTYCDSCLKLKGGTYQAITNISRKKIFSNEDIDNFFDIIEKEINRLKSIDRNAIIPKHDITKFKIKLYFNSEKLAKNISQIIINTWGGTLTEFTMKGKKRGKIDKKSHKLIINIKLPEFSLGDILNVDENLYIVKSFKRDSINLFNLKTKTSESFSLKKNFKYRIIKSKDELTKFLVISIYDDVIQIMDEKTYEIYEILKSDELLNINTDSKLIGLIYNKQIYIISKYDQNV